MVVIMVIMALAIDAGILYAERRKMQNAADAGALAGAMVLCKDGAAAARTAAVNMARANGAQVQNAGVTFPDARTVSVPVTTTGHSIFARILNSSLAASTVGAKATAKCGPIGNVGDSAFPLVVWNDPTFQTGKATTLQISLANLYGWLSWNGDQSAGYLASEFNLAFTGGALPHTVSVGDWITATTGFNNSSSVRKAVKQFEGMTVIMPLFDVYRGTGSNTEYQIVGYAAFHITRYGVKGVGFCDDTVEIENPKCERYLEGEFVQRTTASSSTGGPACSICTIYGAGLTQ